MKKFILVMVFVLLTALIIAFNYLLWDRESKMTELKNLEQEKSSLNASINAQKREISVLEQEISGLRDQLDNKEDETSRLIYEKNELNNDLRKTKESLQERIDFINALKQHVDINTFSKPVVEWAEAINHGNYEEAYDMEYEGVDVQDRSVSLVAYADQFKDTISKIEITEVKLDKLRGLTSGEVYLDVKLNVKLADTPKQKSTRFTQGENEVYIKIDYSQAKKKFIISGIYVM